MAVTYNHEDFDSGKGMLAFPEPFVCVAHTFKKDDSASVEVNGRKIIKQGTLYPNSTKPVGLVWKDYDVTDGDVSGAVLLEGYVKKSALPTVPTTAVGKITFMPVLEEN